MNGKIENIIGSGFLANQFKVHAKLIQKMN